MTELEWRDVGKKMLECEDAVKRFNNKNGKKKHKIDYELLWKDFMNCCIENNYFMGVADDE